MKSIFKNEDSSRSTKKSVLRIISRIYDVLGILSPFTIRARILIQKIWKRNVDWDTRLPEDLCNEWNIWCEEVALLEYFAIPRCIKEDFNAELELYVFSDASPQAYGAVAYVRVKCIENDHIKCRLLIAKSRVTSISNKENPLTLPKLELTGTLCAARLQNYILKNTDLKFSSVNLWSDSKITLAWIQGSPTKWKPYVSNRVKEIQNIS